MSRSSLSEEDVKNRYITPAINKAGWETTDYLTPFVKLSQKNKKGELQNEVSQSLAK